MCTVLQGFINKNLSSKFFYLVLVIGVIMLSTISMAAQCNASFQIPDGDYDVDGNFYNSSCVSFRFDPLITGLPNGIGMELTHTYQGDLSIVVIAANDVLNVLQRPDTDNCESSCPCGSPNSLFGYYVFSEESEMDPENGLSFGGGNYGITTNDPCGIGTVSSFAALWAPFSLDEPIVATICFTDHAYADQGVVSDVSFIFPSDSLICGCIDSTAINFNPAASIDFNYEYQPYNEDANGNSCLYSCPNLNLTVAQDYFEFCGGTDTSASLHAAANIYGNQYINGLEPTYEWTTTNGMDSLIVDPFNRNSSIAIPADFIGTINLQVKVIFDDPDENISFSCSDSVNVEVVVIPPPSIEIISSDLVCFDQWESQLYTTTPFDSYLWSTGDTLDSISITSPGLYELTVIDTNGCEGFAVFNAEGAPAVDLSIIGNEISCQGEEVELIVGGGSYPSILWLESGEMGDTIIVPVDSTVNVEVIDSLGCMNRASFTTSVFPPVAPIIEGNSFLCSSNPVGELYVTESFETYLWSTGDTLDTIAITNPGLYEVTVVSNNGCEGSVSFNVEIAPPVELSIIGPDLICEGEEIELTVEGGPFQSIRWLETGEITTSIFVSTGGISTVEVVDTFGCVHSAEFLLEELSSFFPVIEGNNLLCYENGETVLSVENSFNNYNWSTGEVTNAIVVSTVGFYEVSVENEFGCISLASINVDIADPVEVEIIGDAGICQGDVAMLEATAGYINYEWNTGDTGVNINVNTAGIYALTVVDSDGCTGGASFELEIYPLPDPEISGPLELCPNIEGELTVNEDFSSLLWNNGNTSISNLIIGPGNYTVTVTNSDGCMSTAAIQIEEHILATILSIDKPACEDIPNGTASIIVVEGAPVYEYVWDSIIGNNGNENLSKGNHTVSIIDALGCIAVHSFEIDSTILDIETNMTSPSCISTSNGSAEVIVIEGVAPYQIEWSNGVFLSNAISNISSGLYSVTVLDANQCIETSSIFIDESLLDIQTLVSDVNCFGEDSGSALVMVTQGIPPYTYHWSNGLSSNFIKGLAVGNYAVTVSDSADCMLVGQGTVFSPDPLVIGFNTTHDNLSTPEPDGSLEAIVSGGTPPYYYDWGTGPISNFIENLQAGSYQLSVTDFNECKKDTVAVLSIIAPDSGVFNLSQDSGGFSEMKEDQLKLFPNPSLGDFNIEYYGLLPLQKISVLSIEGESLAFNIIERKHEHAFTLSLPQVSSGSYIVLFEIGGEYFFKKVIVQK